MKKLIFVLFALATAMSCGSGKQNVITGEIEGLEPGDRIILAIEDISGSLWTAVDSAVVDSNGRFTIKTNVTDNYVTITRLRPGEEFNPAYARAPRRFLEGYAKLRLTGNANGADGVDVWHHIKMTGGIYDHPDMAEINRQTEEMQPIQIEGMKLLEEGRQSDNDELKQEGMALIMQSNEMFTKINTLNYEFAETHPDIAYSAFLWRYNDRPLDRYERVFNSFTPRVQETPMGKAIKVHIDNTKATQVGGTAPDFALKALDGKDIKLSDFRGQYVLVDFWGSWCGPCRISNPQLVEMYGKLKSQNVNIEFIGIAVQEANDEDWIRAVESDNLAWVQINDTHSVPGRSIQKQYSVVGVPTTLLISPEGRILIRDYAYLAVPSIKEHFNI